MKNSVKDRLNAQSSCAAQFVAEHLVDYEGPWLHVDLAGPTREGERRQDSARPYWSVYSTHCKRPVIGLLVALREN